MASHRLPPLNGIIHLMLVVWDLAVHLRMIGLNAASEGRKPVGYVDDERRLRRRATGVVREAAYSPNVHSEQSKAGSTLGLPVSMSTSGCPKLADACWKPKPTVRSPSSDEAVEDVDMGEYTRPGVDADGDAKSPA